MNILFDIGHPAHVHLFKNFIFWLQSNGHDCTVVTRKKEITNTLLDNCRIEYQCLSSPKSGLIGMTRELVERDYKILRLHRKKKFDIALGTSVSIGHLSLFSKVKSFNFNEDDDAVIPLHAYVSYPFSTKIINPSCLKSKYWQGRRSTHNSYHELAYLHPNNFQPDEKILENYNLKKGQYIVARFSALAAHHDVGAKGIAKPLWEKIEKKLARFPIVKSIEGSRTHEISPWDMHHVLAFARMSISDSQTMSAESAVLGVPSIRCSSFVGKLSYLEELEHKYQLTFGFSPEKESEILRKISQIISEKDSSIWKKRTQKMLKEKVDFTQWMIDYFQTHLNHEK